MAFDHRKPPLPEWFKQASAGGVCRWCGHLIWKDAQTINKRRTWHPECLGPYWITTDPAAARRAVAHRDKGRCADCGKTRAKWECDHIVRLADSPRNIKYWGLDNLQTLCEECHEAKTIRENKNNKVTARAPSSHKKPRKRCLRASCHPDDSDRSDR